MPTRVILAVGAAYRHTRGPTGWGELTPPHAAVRQRATPLPRMPCPLRQTWEGCRVNDGCHDVHVLNAYVDESYSSDFYYIAAAIGTPQAWATVAADFDQIRRRTAALHGTPLDAEFHGHEIMGGIGDWAPLRGRHREAAGVFQAALRACRTAGIEFILRGVDVERLNARYRYPHQPHTVVFGHLLERIDERAVARNDRPVVIVADEIATQAQHLAQFQAYQINGTPGYRPSRLQTIHPAITFASSRLHDGLQAADLAAYLHRRREAAPENHRAAARARAMLERELDPAVVHRLTWYP